MEAKKNILTYEGLRKYEDELHELNVKKLLRKSKKQENRVTYPKMLNTMQQKTNSVTSKPVLKN